MIIFKITVTSGRYFSKISLHVRGRSCIILSLTVTMTLSYICCCFMMKMHCFFTAAVNFTLFPSVLPFDFTVQTLAPKTQTSAQKSHFSSFKQTSSNRWYHCHIIFCSPWAVLMWLCQSNNNPGKWMNSITVPQILSTTMMIPLGFMNMVHSVLPFGECYNVLGHQRHLTEQKHNTLLHGSSSFINHCRPSPEQTFRNSLWTASLTHTT